MIKHLKKDYLAIKIYENRDSMGEAVAKEVVEKIKKILYKKGEVNMVFAAAPSQNEFLSKLVKFKNIEWNKITAFQLDEYIGLENDSPQKFSTYLKNHLFDKVNFRTAYFIDQEKKTVEEKIKRYSELLLKYSLDIACIGIGENGHIAFNDPYVADFADPKNVKKVCLDIQCRMQQVNEGCFKTIRDVPTHAITMTLPAVISANYIYCTVPTKNKNQAIYNCIKGKIGPKYPASILRTHRHAILFIDKDAASLI